MLLKDLISIIKGDNHIIYIDGWIGEYENLCLKQLYQGSKKNIPTNLLNIKFENMFIVGNGDDYDVVIYLKPNIKQNEE